MISKPVEGAILLKVGSQERRCLAIHHIRATVTVTISMLNHYNKLLSLIYRHTNMIVININHYSHVYCNKLTIFRLKAIYPALMLTQDLRVRARWNLGANWFGCRHSKLSATV